MWTKQQLITSAREELGMGSAFDASPEELQSDMRRMDAMIAAWEVKGVRFGYTMATAGGGNLADDSGIPDGAAEAVYLGLALRIAPGYGKAITTETRSAARNAYDALLLDAAFPQAQQLRGGMPAGAGNKPTGSRAVFLPEPDPNPLREGAGESLDILSE